MNYVIMLDELDSLTICSDEWIKSYETMFKRWNNHGICKSKNISKSSLRKL